MIKLTFKKNVPLAILHGNSGLKKKKEEKIRISS